MSFFRGLAIGLGVVAAIGAVILSALAEDHAERPEARHDSDNGSHGGGFHREEDDNGSHRNEYSKQGYRREEYRNRHHGWESEGTNTRRFERRRFPDSSDDENDDTPISYSNPRNNHDDTKVKHESRQAAEREIRRMQTVGLPGSERLNAYYNEDRGGWFVGRSKW
jgi:hypothetical protein